MKISYCSDLHLEFGSRPDFSKELGGDILIIAGDLVPSYSLKEDRTDSESRKIKKYLSTQFKSLCDKYTYIYYVFGNHEYYRCNFKPAQETIKNAFRELGLNIRVMENDTADFGDFAVFGATLWTDYNKDDPITKEIVRNYMNDYKLIGTGTEGLIKTVYDSPVTPDFFYNEHINTLSKLDTFAQQTNKPIVVFTHMAPHLESTYSAHVGTKGDPACFGYGSDLTNFIMSNPNITHWIHGHSHVHKDYMIEQCNVLANCQGYPGEHCYRQFNGLKHFEI